MRSWELSRIIQTWQTRLQSEHLKGIIWWKKWKADQILQENSSKKIEINAEEDENTNYAKTSTSSRGLEQNNVVLKSLSVEREIVELTVNTAKEDESKAFERDEICKYIDEENNNEKNYLKLFK